MCVLLVCFNQHKIRSLTSTFEYFYDKIASIALVRTRGVGALVPNSWVCLWIAACGASVIVAHTASAPTPTLRSRLARWSHGRDRWPWKRAARARLECGAAAQGGVLADLKPAGLREPLEPLETLVSAPLCSIRKQA